MIEVEGNIAYMYLDTEGNVTIGIGHMIQSASDAQGLNFRYKRDQKDVADALEKDAKKGDLVKNKAVVSNAFDTVDAAPHGKDHPADEFENLTEIFLPQEEIDKKFDDDFKDAETRVKGKFSDYDKFPESAQMGLMDMEFNMNGKFNNVAWEDFFNAVNEDPPNWYTAAIESHRKSEQIQDDRNEWTADCFNRAGDAQEKTRPKPLNRQRTDGGSKKTDRTIPAPLTRSRAVAPR